MFRKILSTVLATVMTASVAFGATQVLATPNAKREGSAALIANGGDRPYLEWYNASTLGVQRTQLIYVYAEAGETIYFGSSVVNGYSAVDNASVGVMMPSSSGNAFSANNFTKNPATYVGTAYNRYTAEKNPVILSSFDRSKVYLFDADEATGYGYISTVSQESAGPVYSVNDTTYNAGGYTPFSITVPQGCGGLWTFMYFSSEYTNANPKPTAASDPWSQAGGVVAAWDATVVKPNSDGTVNQLSGRMACKTLFINLGDNTCKLNSSVYVLTDDGFLYNVDFNGADPFGFVFYANNRGPLLNSDSGYQSLMHSAIASNNEMNVFSSKSLNITANNVPVEAIDETYYVFFNEPDTAFIKFVTGRNNVISDKNFTTSNIDNISFIGRLDTGFDSEVNEDGYAPSTEGYGGVFTVTAAPGSVATSFKVRLVFTGNEQVCEALGYSPETENVVTLSNSFSDGIGSVNWDGRDAYGKIIPASEDVYRNIQIEVSATVGETHLPFLDVENNPNGLKVHLVNDISRVSADDKYTVYYNNDNSTGAYGSFKGQTNIGDGKDYSYTGISSKNGAIKYSNKGGDQCAIDMWTYVSLEDEEQSQLSVLIDKKHKTTLQVDKQWEYTSDQGITDENPPAFSTIQLQQRIVGTSKWENYSGDVTEYRNPVTLVASTATGKATYTFAELEWHNDDNAEYEYRVTEAPVPGYIISSDSAMPDSTSISYSVDSVTGLKTYYQSIVNTYKSPEQHVEDTKIYKYFYGYDDSAAGIFGTKERYSAQNDDGYYYLNTEEIATLIYRVRQQEEGLTFEELPDTSSFTDVPNNGWGRKALEWLKDLLGLGQSSGARSTVSSSVVQSVFGAHYNGSGKKLDIDSSDKILRIDFLRAYNIALGRNSISEIYSADGVLLCSRDSDGNYALSPAFTNNMSAYIFSSEMPKNAEEVYQVLLACHSYYVSENGKVAKIAPKLESERYTLDLGLTEAN